MLQVVVGCKGCLLRPLSPGSCSCQLHPNGQLAKGGNKVWVVGWLDGCLVVVLDGHGFVRKEGEGAIVEHCWGKLAHDGKGLEVQAPHHGVAVPSAQHFD